MQRCGITLAPLNVRWEVKMQIPIERELLYPVLALLKTSSSMQSIEAHFMSFFRTEILSLTQPHMSAYRGPN